MKPARRLKVALEASAVVGERTGIGEFVVATAEALAKDPTIELSAFVISWRGRDRFRQELPSGISTRQRPMPARPLHFIWDRSTFPPLELFIGKPDIVHGMNAVLPPRWWSRGILTVHDVAPISHPELCQPNFMPWEKLVRRAIKQGAYVHTPSNFVRNEVIATFDIDPAKVHAIPLGIPTARTPSNATGPEALDRRDADLGSYVLALGTIQPRKDYVNLLKAFDVVAASDGRVRLVIAGSKGWGYEEFESTLATLKHRERVTYLGYVSEQRRLSLLRNATVLAYPSVYEGFGLPPLEAMAEGVPVVSTSVGSIPEVAGDAAALVPPRDPASLAEAISRLLSDEEARAVMSAKGLERVKMYNWTATASALSSLYAQIAAD